MTLLSTKNMSVRLGGHTALRNVDFSIASGEIVTIVGPNGSGKSTLLKALIGAVKPTQGSLERRPGLRIGYVPQKLHIDPTLPISVRRFLSLPKKNSDAEINAALARVGASDLLSKQMFALSGGQFQRTLLARALLEKPDIFVLDEPTTGLDQPGSAALYNLIEELRHETGAAVLMVSHELHVVMSASDRVICLNGHVCCHGTPDVVASAPEYRALFGTGTQGALALYRHEHNHSHDGETHAEHSHV
ncbi:ATP-binding cassette domain-containing protein [Cognatishimia activa]|uniref:Zinc import ATP-binding protein ZnuC n=1 Tax=Cognatishimia activa TaxID=1715691 RepID=A0A0P1ILE1_9RHOB|nr:metal ABC transporter ATP-binding protein [Cognatishimia activa]CUI58327.1 Zinc import ATP-binding protein ZnuC [Cognatishimia activa]CUK24451.1 Zinc import ATP-binding protein ZnuC [Cognatishimia activa]